MKLMQKLAVGHNLNASDLVFADKIGGLVCPSMAIFRSDISFSNFGDITLLMDKSKVNLRTHPAHNADVFSMRFPSCYYKTDKSILDTFSEKVATSVPEMEKEHSIADYHESSVISKGFDHVAQEYMRDPKVLLAYARDNGLNPRIYRSQHKSGITFIDNMEKPKSFLRELKSMGIKSIKEGTDEYTEYSQRLFDEMKSSMRRLAESKGGTPKEIEEDTDYFINHLGKHYFKSVESNPQLLFSPHQKIKDHIRAIERNPNPIDIRKTRDRLEKLVKSDKQKQSFITWLGNHIGNAFHSPYMHVVTRGGNHKKLAFTAENALKAMRGKVQGEEKTIFMGAGSIRSLVAKRFTSYREITSHIHDLVSDDDMKVVGEEFNKRLSDFPEKLAPYYLYQTDSWRYRDAVYEEISDYARSGSLSKLESFNNIDVDVLQELDDFLSDLSQAKTHYFEVKKQSIVGIDDFDAAIVPNGVDPAAIEVLKRANVNITFYDPEQSLSRIKAVNKQQDLLFGNGNEVVIPEPDEQSLEYA